MKQDVTAVVAANTEFYRAFSRRDIAAMEGLWSRRLAVACIHPGWDAIVDRATLIRSWKQILANPASPAVDCRNVTPFVHGDIALVVCHEVIESTVLAATNIFAREPEGWKMIHHQASPLARLPRDEPAPLKTHQLH
jgi:hypothetical protein